MTVSNSVRRLLRVLGLEEESRRRELESAQAELTRLHTALRAATQRGREGRLLFADGVRREDLRDRCSGLEEIDAARRRGEVLMQYIQQSTETVETLRQAFLEKRVERKQAQTLVETAEATESLEEARRTQQALDAWYLMRPTGGRSDEKRPAHESAERPEPEDPTPDGNLKTALKGFPSKRKSGHDSQL